MKKLLLLLLLPIGVLMAQPQTYQFDTIYMENLCGSEPVKVLNTLDSKVTINGTNLSIIIGNDLSMQGVIISAIEEYGTASIELQLNVYNGEPVKEVVYIKFDTNGFHFVADDCLYILLYNSKDL